MWRYRPINGIGFDMNAGIYVISIQEISLKRLYLETIKKYELDPPNDQKSIIEKADCEKRIKEIDEAFEFIEKEFRKPVAELLIKKSEKDRMMSLEEISRKYHNDTLPYDHPKQITPGNLRKAIQKVAYGMAVIDGRIRI